MLRPCEREVCARHHATGPAAGRWLGACANPIQRPRRTIMATSPTACASVCLASQPSLETVTVSSPSRASAGLQVDRVGVGHGSRRRRQRRCGVAHHVNFLGRRSSSETGVNPGDSGDAGLSKQRRRPSPGIAVAALFLISWRVCTEKLVKSVQGRYGRGSRAIAIRPAYEARVRRHGAAARRLQARQGGWRAPPRRRPGTAHELPRLRRPRAALQLLRAPFRVVTPRPRLVPGMSDDGRAVAPPFTDSHT